MAKITAAEVNKLRKATGAGMMDCKKALVETNGDFELAIDFLRKTGQKVAAKRSDRDSSEGVALAKVNSSNTVGYVLSLNCETDFVAKNDSYIALTKSFLDLAESSDVKSLDEFLKLDYEKITVEEKLIEQTGVIGEKIEIKFFERLEAPFVGSYIHANNKIAVVTGLSKSIAESAEVAKDISMQVAAMNPIALDKTGISQEVIDRELQVGKEQAIQEGKPEEMAGKIAQGRLRKFFKENTLLAQMFIKENKTSVENYVKSFDSELKVVSYKKASI